MNIYQTNTKLLCFLNEITIELNILAAANTLNWHVNHCRLNELPRTISWKILVSNFRYVRLCDLDILGGKNG